MYSIKEVADRFGVSKNTLRYYESEGLLPPITRDQQGIRHYSDSDVEAVNKVVHFRRLGATVKETKNFVQLSETDFTPAKVDEALTFLTHLDVELDKRIADIEQQKQFLKQKLTHLKQLKQQPDA
ncbi:MerR family transcriptional regulator [Levilactobacillus bambusae]|uniref:MerR family transcriptional regulator n=1 Tax=Levilactobacillus bambusae TaxID=2024736 RepID=A0A2V1MZJ0_9LACO|nr:MerR family transcriptional regulator [Levilactobacillus bambusae]PWG00397.1 MerR family transcriptional regulator [Levilactobacillus bambusae]